MRTARIVGPAPMTGVMPLAPVSVTLLRMEIPSSIAAAVAISIRSPLAAPWTQACSVVLQGAAPGYVSVPVAVLAERSNTSPTSSKRWRFTLTARARPWPRW